MCWLKAAPGPGDSAGRAEERSSSGGKAARSPDVIDRSYELFDAFARAIGPRFDVGTCLAACCASFRVSRAAGVSCWTSHAGSDILRGAERLQGSSRAERSHRCDTAVLLGPSCLRKYFRALYPVSAALHQPTAACRHPCRHCCRHNAVPTFALLPLCLSLILQLPAHVLQVCFTSMGLRPTGSNV